MESFNGHDLSSSLSECDGVAIFIHSSGDVQRKAFISLTAKGLTVEIKVGCRGWEKEHLLAQNPEENAIFVLKKRTLACSQAFI